VAATFALAHGAFRLTRSASTQAPVGATEEYGRRLIEETTAFLGPDVADPEMRYTSSRLACASCHLAIGTEPGTLTLLQANDRYPRFSGRVSAKTDLADRVNECMQRSLNGRPLRRDSVEMIAMVSYIKSLADLNAALGASARKAKEPPVFRTPDRAANLIAGRHVFEQRCAACHGADGQGLRASTDPLQGYVFPPLWGPDSFNDGAGMHRVLTAARFVKARMPLGKPDLTDDQAFDVAAFLNSQPRPEMANLAQDYPDRAAKPVDTGYGPFDDSFPLDQHRFGPFGPIDAYYRKLREKK
jgi:thiosulfate dehydrogenase